VLDSVLAWIRRGLAVGILAAMLLPLVTVQGCEADAPKITYTGWALVWEAPTLVSIPLFAVAAAGLAFVSRRGRSAVGRHILALLKIIFAGAAGAWTYWAFAVWSSAMEVWTEIGFWLILVACSGIVACDLVEAGAAWIAWRRWKRSRAIPLLDDSLIRLTGLGGIASGLLFAVLGVLPTIGYAVEEERPEAPIWIFLVSAFVFLAAWGATASLAGWGVRRGLGWARLLTHLGAWATTFLAAGLLYLTFIFMTQDFDKWERLRFDQVDENLLWGWAVIAFLLAWLVWTWWTVRVVLGWRGRLFPSRRVRVETARRGGLRVRVPRCPDCRARLWLSPDGAQLVCRPCGKTYAATIESARATYR